MSDATNCSNTIHEWTRMNLVEKQTAKTESLYFDTPFNIGLVFNEEIVFILVCEDPGRPDRQRPEVDTPQETFNSNISK